MVFTPERILATFLVAIVLAVCWRYADREGREAMLPAAVVNWGFALIFAVLLGAGLIYAQGIGGPGGGYEHCDPWWLLMFGICL